jgi:hypothetical protein
MKIKTRKTLKERMQLFAIEWHMLRIKKNIGIGILLCCLLLSGCSEKVVDTDGDDIPDNEDDFPNDASVSSDSDDDGYPDQYNQGYNASNTNITLDAFPNEPLEWNDGDGDGVGDNSDDFPYDAELSKLFGGNQKTCNLVVAGEINENIDVVKGDKRIIIYWELQGESFNKMAGEVLNMRYNSAHGWSPYFSGRTDQITIDLSDDDEGQWTIRFQHDGRTTDPPYTENISIAYNVAKAR